MSKHPTNTHTMQGTTAMKHSPRTIVVMLALAGLLSACNPIWEAPPIERLRASPSATITDTPASNRTAR